MDHSQQMKITSIKAICVEMSSQVLTARTDTDTGMHKV